MAWAVLCAYKGVVKVRQQGKNARENGYLFQIDTLAVTEQARRLAASGKLEAASIVLEDLLAGGKDAVNPRTVDLAARVRARTGDFEGARSLWEWLLEKEPENPNYKRAWARCKKAGRGSFHRFVACFPWQYAVASVLVVCIALGALSATLSRRGQSLPGRSDRFYHAGDRRHFERRLRAPSDRHRFRFPRSEDARSGLVTVEETGTGGTPSRAIRRGSC